MSVEIGGGKAWARYLRGDVGISFQWVNHEPAMILFRLTGTGQIPGAYVICLSAAWKYADSKTGAPTPWLVKQSIEAAAHIGFSRTDLQAARKIADLIVDFLPELLAMPPELVENDNNAPEIGEIRLSVDGKTVLEKALTETDDA